MATLPQMAPAGREPSIGRVFSLAFGTIRAQPVVTFALTFVAGALPSRVLDYGAHRAEPFLHDRLSIGGQLAGYLVILLLAFAVSSVAQAALVPPVWCKAMNRRARFGESLGAMLVILPTLLAVGMIVAAVAAAGFLAFIVPGVIAICAWGVAVPVAMVEQCGPLEALRRSAYLTRGARWKLFALLIINLAATWLVDIGQRRVLILLPDTQAALGLTRLGIDVPLVPYLVTSLFQMINGGLFVCVGNALYIELRAWKDGPPPDALAEVFA